MLLLPGTWLLQHGVGGVGVSCLKPGPLCGIPSYSIGSWGKGSLCFLAEPAWTGASVNLRRDWVVAQMPKGLTVATKVY